MSKPNKDGWIRHRGGICPLNAGEHIEFRKRNGLVDKGVAGLLSWAHFGFADEVMAYRLHKPEQVEPAVVANVEQAEMPAAKYFDGPLQWRDRIREIESIVESLKEERASLVQKLEDEGFKLI